MKPSEYLAKGWCQNCFAIDANGSSVSALNPAAIAWCIHAAVVRSVKDGTITQEENAAIHRSLSSICQDRYHTNQITTVNDRILDRNTGQSIAVQLMQLAEQQALGNQA